MEKVVLGLSGGVDSALCARLLLEQGHEVVGVYLETGGQGAQDARQAARELGIQLEVVDIRPALEQEVIAPFVQGYLQGITPIPCILCNPAVKFRFLMEAAEKLGCQLVATGHYAITRPLENGLTGLFASPAPNDQSYMLYRLPEPWLRRIRFPLGQLPDKGSTRQQARQAGLSVAQKPDSMEICFIPQGDYAAFIEERGGPVPPPGDFVDEEGHVLGRHKGIHHYTVGQRRGLGVSAASRLFVKTIDPAKNQVVLTDKDPMARQITVHSLCKTAPDVGDQPFEADVKIRHSRRTDRALVTYLPGEMARIEFLQPARAPSPGQSAVFYQNGRVLGDGFIRLPADEG